MKRTYLWLFAALALQGLGACAQHEAAGSSATNAGTSSDAVAAGTALQAYHWQMPKTLDSGNQAPVQLTFQDGSVFVEGLCNTLRTGYQINGSAMTMGKVAGTLRMCDDPALMKFEQDVAARLETTASFGIAGAAAQDPGQQPVLTLRFADASEWQLQGKPTNETKYGSAAETIFLEVEPQLAPCSHPLIPNKQCMRVRTIEFDANGLKRNQGEWQLFYDDIEGYTHTAGVRNVLRIKRYTRPNPPADASRYVYVLDMVVQASQEKAAR